MVEMELQDTRKIEEDLKLRYKNDTQAWRVLAWALSFLAISFALLLCVAVASAATITHQDDDATTHTATSTEYNPEQKLGSGLYGTLERIKIKATDCTNISLLEYPSFTYTYASATEYGLSGAGTGGDACNGTWFTTITHPTLSTDHYYSIRFTGTWDNIQGSNNEASFFPGSFCYRTTSASDSALVCGTMNVKDIYFQFTDEATTPSSTIAFEYPADDQATSIYFNNWSLNIHYATATDQFSYPFYTAIVYTAATSTDLDYNTIAELNAHAVTQGSLVVDCDVFSCDGDNNSTALVQNEMNFRKNATYYARAVLLYGTTITAVSDVIVFHTNNATISETIANPIYGFETGTSSTFFVLDDCPEASGFLSSTTLDSFVCNVSNTFKRFFNAGQEATQKAFSAIGVFVGHIFPLSVINHIEEDMETARYNNAMAQATISIKFLDTEYDLISSSTISGASGTWGIAFNTIFEYIMYVATGAIMLIISILVVAGLKNEG